MIRGHSGLECVLLVWAFSEWTVWIFTLNSHRNMPSLNHEISPGSINIGVFLLHSVCVCVRCDVGSKPAHGAKMGGQMNTCAVSLSAGGGCRHHVGAAGPR